MSPSWSRVIPSAWQSRPGPLQRSLGSSSPRRRAISSSPAVGSSARRRTGSGDALVAADDVHAPVDAVGAVDVDVAAAEEHRGIPRGAAVAIPVRGGILVVVGLDLDDHPAHAVQKQLRPDQVGRDVVRAATQV